MKTNTVELNHQKRNGKVHNKAAALEAVVEEVPPPATTPSAVEGTAAPGVTPPAAPAPSATEEGPGEEPQRPPATRSPQAEALYRLLAEIDDKLRGLEGAGDPLAALLTANRITQARLAAVRVLYNAAQAAMDVRGDAMGAETTATIAMQRAQTLVEIAYVAFRQVGRIIFPDPVMDRDARLNLALDLPMPASITLLVDKGRKVLAKAKQDPQAVRLSAAGYDSERIDEMLAPFDALDILYTERRQARQVAKNATTARNVAIAELRMAMRQLRFEVAAILKAHPEVNPPADF